MKNNVSYKYADISSFRDIKTEKERLKLKKSIAEAKFELRYMQFRETLSVTNMFMSLAREFIVPKVSDILSRLAKKSGNNSSDLKEEQD